MAKFSDFLPGIISGISESAQRRREEEEKIRAVIAAAFAQQAASSAFPSAEEQVKTQLLEEAERVGEVPQPLGGFNIQERQAGIPGQVEEAARGRKIDALMNILRGSGASGTIPVIAFDPATGTISEAGNVPRGARVLPTRTTPEEAANLAGARVTGQATPEALKAKEEISAATERGKVSATPLTPEQNALVQNFEELRKSTARIDELLSEDTDSFNEKLFLTGVPFQPGTGELADELNNAADILLRMRSGAAINQDEFVRLRGLLPRGRTAISELLGNPGRARQMIARFNEAATEIFQKKRTKGNLEGRQTQPISIGEDFSQLSDEELLAIAEGR